MATTNPETPAAEVAAAAAPASSGGGLSAWLPLIIAVVAMPALAYVTTTFVLLPKMKEAVATAAPASPAGEEAAGTAPAAPAAPAASAKGKEKGAPAFELTPAMKEKGVKVSPNGKISVPLNKILVNVAGTMGSRYLLTSVTLASSKPQFAEHVLSSEAQLLDLAAGVLAGKSIADLEKPAARTVVRTELLTVFNNVLGAGMVEDIFFTEFAIQ